MTRLASFFLTSLIGFLLYSATSGNLLAQSTELAQSYYHASLGQLLYHQQEYLEAVTEFEKALALEPDNARLHGQLGAVLDEAGEPSRAVEALQKAVALDPKLGEAHYRLGRIYSREGRDEDAEIAFSQAVESNPQSFEATYSLASAYFQRGEYRKAAEFYGRALDLRPLPQVFFQKAYSHLQLNEIDEAIAVLTESADSAPHPQNLVLLGQQLERRGQRRESLEFYKQALAMQSDPQLQTRVAGLLNDLGRFEEALALISGSPEGTEVEDSPTAELQRQILLERARAVAGLGRLEEASSILKGLLAESSDRQVQLVLGRVLQAQRDLAGADRVYAQLLQKDPNDLVAVFDSVQVLRRMGETDEAIRRLEFLLSSNSGEGNRRIIQRQLAALFVERGRFDEGIRLFEEEYRERENRGSGLRLIAALRQTKRLERALELGEELLQRYPEDREVAISRAQVLSAAGRLSDALKVLGDQDSVDEMGEAFFLLSSQFQLDNREYREAVQTVDNALDRWPDSESLLFQKAAVLERQGDIGRAETTFRKILEKNPDHDGVLNYLGYMLAEQGMKLEEAFQFISKAVAMDPYNGAYLDSLGWVYYRLNKLDLAKENLEKAAQINDRDGTIYEHLGDLHRKLGDLGEAARYYQLSIEHAGEGDKPENVRQKLNELGLAPKL